MGYKERLLLPVEDSIMSMTDDPEISASIDGHEILSFVFTADEIAIADLNARNIRAGINLPSQYTTNEIIALQHLHPEVMRQNLRQEVINA